MTMETSFGRRGARAPVRAPAVRVAIPEPAAAPRAPTSYRDLDGAQRLIADIPFLTLAMAVALWIIFRIQVASAFDIGPNGDLSVESLIAQGANSFDLAITHGEIWRVAMAPLLHASASHLFGNLLAMVLIGIVLEPLIGRGWLLAIYALSGLGGEIGSLIGNAASTPGVGASGAITGLLAAALVMSFTADDPDQAAKLRRRALFFGGPALAPLLWHAHDHVDYFAHLGGALAGGGVALVLSQVWDRDDFRPPAARWATLAATALLALGAPGAAFAAAGYDARAANAAQFIPTRELMGDIKQLAARSRRLERDYPKDPLTKVFAGVRMAIDEDYAAADAELHSAMDAQLPDRPWAERPVHAFAQALLAVVLIYERRGEEAKAYARPLCASQDQPSIPEMLKKAKLCPA